MSMPSYYALQCEGRRGIIPKKLESPLVLLGGQRGLSGSPLIFPHDLA